MMARTVRLRPYSNGFGFTLRFCTNGTSVGESRSVVFIKSVVHNGPASVAGLSAGDRIEAINGVAVDGRPYQDIIDRIRDSSTVLELIITPQAVSGETLFQLVDETRLKIKNASYRRPQSSDFDRKRTSTDSDSSQFRHRFMSSGGSSLSVEKGESHSGSHHSHERLTSCSDERLATAHFSRSKHSPLQVQRSNATRKQASRAIVVNALKQRGVLPQRRFTDSRLHVPANAVVYEAARQSDYNSTSFTPYMSQVGYTESSGDKSGQLLAGAPANVKSDEVIGKLRALTSSTDISHLRKPDDDGDTTSNKHCSSLQRDEESLSSIRQSHSHLPGSTNTSNVYEGQHLGSRVHAGKSYFSHDDLPSAAELQNNQLKRMQSEQCDLNVRTQSERVTNGVYPKWKRVKSGAVPHKKVPAFRRSATIADQISVEPETFFSSRKFQLDGLVSVDTGLAVSPQTGDLGTAAVGLPYMDPVVKSGYLYRKQTVESNGKKAKYRSWKVSYYELRGHMLYSYKDKKEAEKPENFEEQPLSVKFCRVDIAYGYVKRPYTFRFISYNGSEYLFQTSSDESMMEWIEGIKAHSDPDDDLENKARADLIIRKAVEERQRQVERGIRPRPSIGLGQAIPITVKTDVSDGASDSTARKVAGSQLELQREEEFNELFKKSLDDCEMSDTHPDVPLFIVRCVEEVETRGLDVEGIYRVPGNKAEICLLRDELQKDLAGADFTDERWHSIYNVTSILKLFLRELRQSIFPKDMYDNFMSASKVDDEDQSLIMLKQLIQELPHLNFCTLRYLIRHLQHVASKADLNKMYPKYLAVVFGPSLVRREISDLQHVMSDMGNQCNIVNRLIVHGNWFFGSSHGDDRKQRPFVRPSRSCDFLASEFTTTNQSVNGSVIDGSESPPPKPRRTMQYDPEDPDDGTESSDFWVRYPPTKSAPGAERVSTAAQMDSTSHWIRQMASQAWQSESGSSSPASFKQRQKQDVPSNGSAAQHQSETRGTQQLRSLALHQSVGYQRALQALQAVANARSGGNINETEKGDESSLNSNISISGLVVRRERRGRRNWRGAKVTDSADLSGESTVLQSTDWSKIENVGKTDVRIKRRSQIEEISDGKIGDGDVQTTLL